MTPTARLSAAIEVLAEIGERRRPASDALKDWGLAHRFAGSGDRAAIGGLVYDALRRRASAAWIMGGEAPRAVLLGMLRLERGLEAGAIARLCEGRFAPEPLTGDEQERLTAVDFSGAPEHVVGDYPEWLDAHLAASFGEARAEEGAALAKRAPLDLRVNVLKASREEAAETVEPLGAAPTPWSPIGYRLVHGPDSKSPAIHAEPGFIKGVIEIQDEGSQIAALLTGAAPGEQIVDLCAGAGGKTLVLAALTQNKGQIFATDSDKRRLAPIHARLERAGVRNVQVRTPRPGKDALADIAGSADLIVIDAPCSGTGAWRRNPDAKWRMRPGALEQRLADQARVLDQAVPLLKPGGRIAYITCSVLRDENDEQVCAFLGRYPDFAVQDLPLDVALKDKAAAFREAVLTTPYGLLMTPRRTGTDGFFVSLLSR